MPDAPDANPSKLTAAATLLAALASPAALAAVPPGVTPLQENRPVDVDSVAAAANAPAIEDVTLTAALVKGKPASTAFARPVMVPGGQRAVAWSECSKTACLGYWALLDGDNETLKVVARGALPLREKVHFDDGYSFQGTAVVALDESGRAYVLFHYQATEPPRKTNGSLSHEYATLLDPAARKIVFHHELKRAGAPSETTCSYTLIPRVEGNAPAIEAKSSCAVRACLEKSPAPAGCAPPTSASEKFVLKKGAFAATK
jgi:hypothetical protein